VGGKRRGTVVSAAQLVEMRKAGVDPALVDRLTPLVDKELHGEAELAELITKTLGPEGAMRYRGEVLAKGFRPPSVELEPPTGFSANGYLGQYLVVYPKKGLVAVRMYRGPENEHAEPAPRTGFPAFASMVDALVK
jgi:hypothetical protein